MSDRNQSEVVSVNCEGFSNRTPPPRLYDLIEIGLLY